jgi:hypothetical protein
MRKAGVVILMLLLGAAGGRAEAAGGVDCVKAECEGKGRTCVETLYVADEACRKAANKKCNGVQPADKFNCLKAELTPCALTRNDKQAACLADVQACYTSCGPFESGRADYWCVVDFDSGTTAGFCAADPAAESITDQCVQAISTGGQMFGGMTCEPLRILNP